MSDEGNTTEETPGEVSAAVDQADQPQQSADSEPFQKNAASQDNLDVVLDIPVAMSLEVGSTRLSIRRLLQLNKGSVIELAQAAGDPLNVMVNGTLVAHGEVVVINEKFGIRLVDVTSTEQRIRTLD